MSVNYFQIAGVASLSAVLIIVTAVRPSNLTLLYFGMTEYGRKIFHVKYIEVSSD
jgi:hypothetical protein